MTILSVCCCVDVVADTVLMLLASPSRVRYQHRALQRWWRACGAGETAGEHPHARDQHRSSIGTVIRLVIVDVDGDDDDDDDDDDDLLVDVDGARLCLCLSVSFSVSVSVSVPLCLCLYDVRVYTHKCVFARAVMVRGALRHCRKISASSTSCRISMLHRRTFWYHAPSLPPLLSPSFPPSLVP